MKKVKKAQATRRDQDAAAGDRALKVSWGAVELELVRDGHLARVSRTMKPGRWRWCVAPMDHVLKWNRNVTDVPFAKGFSGTRERAIEMAEAAINALKKESEKNATQKT